MTRRESTLYLSWVISIFATFGSLYFSEVREFVPCDLCWYQRIMMYPLTIILGIAAYQNNKSIKHYVLPLSILGGCISLFHYLEQKVPGFAAIKPCKNGVPCSTEYINWFGFVTIPFLALTAFSLITLLLLLTKNK